MAINLYLAANVVPHNEEFSELCVHAGRKGLDVHWNMPALSRSGFMSPAIGSASSSAENHSDPTVSAPNDGTSSFDIFTKNAQRELVGNFIVERRHVERCSKRAKAEDCTIDCRLTKANQAQLRAA
ncbi:hypothetical protein [Bradyrhizobium sp. JYMT SZCCT0428]|uniref:hypothetical protein n=1 Tax=Bradyrhizobium sp. JYMT SZCCT0428 TaxID=2807673 RepID=UPI001BAC4FC8|nr:hypothetical protein [Bradyrhizobium sp. JYMT SZCCT0428]MBR1157386.1 hypothetical protein [Bradyrhizobium sp. JYMT SZCCT0428]